MDEAKRDAVMNEQYLQDLDGPDERVQKLAASPTPESALSAAAVPSRADLPLPLATEHNSHSESSDSSADEGADEVSSAAHAGHESPSLLTDAFLRTGEQEHTTDAFHNQINHVSHSTINTGSDIRQSDDELDGCMTISLPSPRSLLNSQ